MTATTPSVNSVRVPCVIIEKELRKSSEPRYWCTAHHASATAKYGVKLSECEVAYLQPPDSKPLVINLEEYPGGIGLWGAVSPVYDTSNIPPESGIHVHARKIVAGKKLIDRTYSEALVSVPQKYLGLGNRLIRVTGKSAVSHYVSKFFKQQLITNFCTHCGSQHLDCEQFSLKPHRRHLCHQCQQEFIDTKRGISNPIIELQDICGDSSDKRVLKRSTDKIEFNQREFPGGVQIWASNKAVLWTSPKEELEGIHVHTYAQPGHVPRNDETYGCVVIDGIELNETMLGFYMAQKSLAYLENRLAALDCPKCNAPHFDKNEHAYTPHRNHTCESCGNTFTAPGSRKLVISNPFVRTVSQLKQNFLAIG